MKKEDLEESASTIRSVGRYVGLGSQLAATMVASFFLGYWLDGILNIFPWLTIIFSILGCVSGLYSFIKTTIKISEKKNNE